MTKEQDNPLGKWEVRRIDPNRIELKLPEGMKIEGHDSLSIEDIQDAIDTYLRHGPIGPKCCRRRVMIA